MARSLNTITLIGNLTKDPEVRTTLQGTNVTTFSLATNREWVVNGEKKNETQFHRIVAWAKLADLCAQYLHKGSKAFVSGMLTYRTYTNKEGNEVQVSEIIINDMIILDPKREVGGGENNG